MSASADPVPEAEPSWHGLEPGSGVEAQAGEFFQALRRLRERAPVNLTPMGFWLSRYRDCVRLLRDVPSGGGAASRVTGALA